MQATYPKKSRMSFLSYPAAELLKELDLMIKSRVIANETFKPPFQKDIKELLIRAKAYIEDGRGGRGDKDSWETFFYVYHTRILGLSDFQSENKAIFAKTLRELEAFIDLMESFGKFRTLQSAEITVTKRFSLFLRGLSAIAGSYNYNKMMAEAHADLPA